MADPGIAIRASDADREHVVEILRRGHVDGRLTLAELEERSAVAYAAVSWAELTPLTADLPAPPPERAARTARVPGGLGGTTPVVVAALVGAWVVMVAVFGVVVPPLPLLLFIVFRVAVARRGRPA